VGLVGDWGGGSVGAGRPARRSSPTTGDAGSGDPAYRGGRLGGARCLPIGFGEDRETRSLPDWSLAVRGRAI